MRNKGRLWGREIILSITTMVKGRNTKKMMNNSPISKSSCRSSNQSLSSTILKEVNMRAGQMLLAVLQDLSIIFKRMMTWGQATSSQSLESSSRTLTLPRRLLAHINLTLQSIRKSLSKRSIKGGTMTSTKTPTIWYSIQVLSTVRRKTEMKRFDIMYKNCS